MIDAATIRNLMKRVERLEEQVAGLPQAVNDSNDASLDRTALDRAIRDLVRGNSKTLDRYLRRGGKIPIAELKGESHGKSAHHREDPDGRRALSERP